MVSKKGWIENWASLTKPIVKLSNFFLKWGTDQGGMQIIIKGTDTHLKTKTIKWSLYADNGIGPYTPTLAAIIVAKKLMSDKLNKVGATACLDLFDREDVYTHAKAQGIYFREKIIYP